MNMPLSAVREDLQERLGDTDGSIWGPAELDSYIREGYDDLVAKTGCLWATDVLPDYAAAFTHTGADGWEVEYFPADWLVADCCQFTAEFERDYAFPNQAGPANHNYRWENNDGYLSGAGFSVYPLGLNDLPEDFLELERACWNMKRISTLDSRFLEENDGRYELNRGEVQGYAQDKDGLLKFRKWHAPSADYVPYEMDDEDERWGVLVDISDIDDATPEGVWGDFVQVSGEHLMGDPWGVIVGVYKEPNNVRIEYRRRGADLDEDHPFEIPDRYTVYVRHFAQARALEREGAGQEIDLAAHYDSRYKAGIERMLRRKQAMAFQQAVVLGSGGTAPRNRGPRLVRLPYPYGQVVR